MALIQHRQIEDRLKANYLPLIQLDDVPDAHQELAGLSRATAALAVVYLADADLKTACESIVDGGGDNGIDAIYYDPNEKTLYLVQAKWNTNHNGGIENGSVLKFLQGAKNLMNSKYEKFNEKVRSRRLQIDSALSNASKVQIVLAYTGSAELSHENKASLAEFQQEVDETGELLGVRVLAQNVLHTYISSGVQGAGVSETIQIFDWGWIEAPVRAYYGKIAASDVANLYRKYGPKLFSKNIRMFLGADSSANRGIMETISQHPEHFWYFNNGITALASQISRRAIGGNNREAGQFHCEDFSVVNGAQTVGSLSSRSLTDAVNLANAVVPIRIIQTDGAPDGLASAITRNNNTQNRIDPRNFVALDPVQERLRTEFLIDGIDYEYRQGEVEHSAGSRLGLVEATVALACTSKSVDLSTQAKREIGRLWEDTSRAPYRLLFNDGQTSDKIWSRVSAFRRIDAVVTSKQVTSSDKDRNIAIHGNRFLVHVVYAKLIASGASESLGDQTEASIGSAFNSVFSDVSDYISKYFSDSYLASLFKNHAKCKEIADALSASKALD